MEGRHLPEHIFPGMVDAVYVGAIFDSCPGDFLGRVGAGRGGGRSGECCRRTISFVASDISHFGLSSFFFLLNHVEQGVRELCFG